MSTPANQIVKYSKAIQVTSQKQFPYRLAIGSLIYLTIYARPDTAYIVGILSRYMEQPAIVHWNGVKRIF